MIGSSCAGVACKDWYEITALQKCSQIKVSSGSKEFNYAIPGKHPFLKKEFRGFDRPLQCLLKSTALFPQDQ